MADDISAPSSATRPRQGGSQRIRSREEIVEALRAAHNNISEAARKLGVHRQRIHEWIEADPTLKDVREDIRQSQIDFAESKLLQCINEGKERSIHFLLKTQGKDRGWSEKVILGTEPGQPLGIEAVTIFELPSNGRDRTTA